MTDYSKITLSPYEYWDLRLRHFEVMRIISNFSDDAYEEIKNTLFKELDDFLKGQENYGIRTTSE